MKSANMKAPLLAELISQRLDYAAHLKKLEQIREQRKHNLAVEVKITKQGSFEQKFIERSMAIHKSNTQLMSKLQKAKSALPDTKTRSERSLTSSSVYSNKRKLIEQQKQNYRIRARMQSVSSPLSSKSMQKEYNKSMQIKNRLMKYRNQDGGKVVLKTQKLLTNAYKGNSQSRITHSIRENRRKTENLENNKPQPDHQTRGFLDSKLKAPYSYYNKEEIFKNKVSSNIKLLKMARDRKLRSITMTQQEYQLPRKLNKSEVKNQDPKNEHKGFFPTQVKK